jgi:dienelactone hydrolase
MRRILGILIALAVTAPSAAGATATAYSLGTVTTQVKEWNASLHSLDVELRGYIALPAGTGPAPVVLVQHGSYPVCHTPNGAKVDDPRYPCGPGTTMIDSALGHKDLVEALADAGFVALSVDANAAYPMDNAVPYGDLFESTTTGAFDLRAQLTDLHLGALGVASAGGANAFGVPLSGRADLTRVGLAGHSRGAQGMVEAALRPHTAFTVRALFLASPTNFYDDTPPDLPLHIVLSSCDGDVWNLAGAGFYDRARGARTAPLGQTLVLGANHNWYTSAWGESTTWGYDDSPPTGTCRAQNVPKLRPTDVQQLQLQRTVATAFFRRHLLGAAPSATLGETTLPRSIAGLGTVSSYEPGAADRLDIDRPAVPGKTALGTTVRRRGLTLGYLTLATPALGTLPTQRWSPHRLAVRTLRWRAPGGFVSLPLASTDARTYDALSFRAAADVWAAPGAALFDVVLRDTRGRRRAIRVRIAPQRPATGAYRKAVLGTIRIPLRRFRGVDLAHLRTLELRPASRRGALMVADVALVRLP